MYVLVHVFVYVYIAGVITATLYRVIEMSFEICYVNFVRFICDECKLTGTIDLPLSNYMGSICQGFEVMRGYCEQDCFINSTSRQQIIQVVHVGGEASGYFFECIGYDILSCCSRTTFLTIGFLPLLVNFNS